MTPLSGENDTMRFRQWLADHGDCVTLGEILSTHFSAEYRKGFSLLRKQGINFVVKLNRKEPSKNLYTLDRSDLSQTTEVALKIEFEGEQAVMGF